MLVLMAACNRNAEPKKPVHAPAMSTAPAANLSRAQAPAADDREQRAAIEHRMQALAGRADPESLRQRALLALVHGPIGSPAFLAAARAAARAAPQDAWAATLEYLACLRTPDCDADAVQQRVQALDPANAANYLDDLQRAVQSGDRDAIGQALEAAGRATRYDTGFERMRQDIEQALAGVPISPALQEQMGREHGLPPAAREQAARRVLAMDAVATLPAPPLKPVIDQCLPPAAVSPSRRADCYALAQSMAAEGTLLSNLTSVRLRLALAPPAEQAAVREQVRQFYWLWSHLNLPERYVLQASGATEANRLRQALVLAGLPPTAPADWLPADACARARVTGGPRPPGC